MSDLNNNLCFWNVGDTISANRLNQMVCKINTSITYQNGINSGTTTSIDGGKISSNKGKYNRHLHYMHDQDGVGKVIDSYVNPKITDGIYARRTGVSGVNTVLYHPSNTELSEISCITDGVELYQKITTDNTGYPKNSEIIRITADDSKPHSSVWKYTECSGADGVIYNRLSRTVVDCRVSCGTRVKSVKYTTIKTNDFFIPPVAQNAENNNNKLVMPMVGNTVPVRTLRPSCGIIMTTCDTHIDVQLKKAHSSTSQLGGVYSITMDSAASNPSINNGQIIIPTVGGGGSITYTAGDAISGSDLANRNISVLPANSSNCQKGYVYSISSDSSITSPSIDNGVIKIPPSSPSYCFDHNWFSICNGVITLNTTKLTAIAQEIADNTNVNISVSGVVDCTVSGRVVVNTSGITCLNDVTTNVSIQ